MFSGEKRMFSTKKSRMFALLLLLRPGSGLRAAVAPASVEGDEHVLRLHLRALRELKKQKVFKTDVN